MNTTKQSARLMVLWGPSAASLQFDEDYCRNHVRLVKAIPGLLDVRISMLRSRTQDRLAELVCAGPDELRQSMASDEAVAAGRDAKRLEQIYGMTSENHIAGPDTTIGEQPDE